MLKKTPNNLISCEDRTGFVLLVTLVLLIVLSMLGYTLTARLADRRHRDRYIMDYQIAHYARDSGVKYALSVLDGISAQLISRPNEPDFSDLFALTETEVREFLEEWFAENALDFTEGLSDVNDANDRKKDKEFAAIKDSGGLSFLKEAGFAGWTGDFNGIEDINDANTRGLGESGIADLNDVNSFTIRGPYGAPWPFIAEPVEFEIGSATVKIEIEDENAKYPIGWALLDDEEVKKEIEAGLETFCGWMATEEAELDIELLKSQLEEIKQIKPFKLEFKPIKITEKKVIQRPASRSRRAGSSRRRGTYTRTTTKTLPMTVHISDFTKLLHASIINKEQLAKPTISSDSRRESLLKYMGMWGSGKVNINTAPRHVLEAAFSFGGDAPEIAEEVIRRRRMKPFRKVEDLRNDLLRYSDSIRKCEEYITTVSSMFTIRVTAISGVAKASAVIGIRKESPEPQTTSAGTGGRSPSRRTSTRKKKSGPKTEIIAVVGS